MRRKVFDIRHDHELAVKEFGTGFGVNIGVIGEQLGIAVQPYDLAESRLDGSGMELQDGVLTGKPPSREPVALVLGIRLAHPVLTLGGQTAQAGLANPVAFGGVLRRWREI